MSERMDMMRLKEGHRVVGLVSRGALVLAILTMVGCGSGGVLNRDGLPAKKYLVGGGLMIEWKASESGTAYLVEETTKKILLTQSVEKGEDVSFSPGSDSQEESESLLGIKLADAKFSLFFVPGPEESSDK